MRFTALSAMFFLAMHTAQADSSDQDEDLDFLNLKQGEENRAKAEADRAPSGDFFLDDEEDEEDGDVSQWEVSAASTQDTHLDGDDPDEDDPDMGDDTSIFQMEDEDLDGDPVEDLSPEDRIAILRPLADNFPLQVVSKDLGQVTVELPVLVAQSQRDFPGEDYWVIAEVLVNGTPISEGRHLITQSSIAQGGPTSVWFKLSAPLDGPEATVEVRVSRASIRGGRPQILFSRSVAVQM